jgi:hypothetical protein
MIESININTESKRNSKTKKDNNNNIIRRKLSKFNNIT